jgi:hypothetical protein
VDFLDAASDEVDGGGAGEVEVAVAGGVPDIGALAAGGGGELSAEGTGEESGARGTLGYRRGWEGVSKRID